MATQFIFDSDIFDGSGTNGDFIFDDSAPTPVRENIITLYIDDPAENPVELTADE